MERTDDTTVSDIAADLIYTGGLNNAGEVLRLLDPVGKVVDSVDGGGGWPAGGGAQRAAMERHAPERPDAPANWSTNVGVRRNGRAADGSPIYGTPRQPNGAAPTATPIAAADDPDGLSVGNPILGKSGEPHQSQPEQVIPTLVAATSEALSRTLPPVEWSANSVRAPFSANGVLMLPAPANVGSFYVPGGALGFSGFVEIANVSPVQVTALLPGWTPVRVIDITVHAENGAPVSGLQFSPGLQPRLCFNALPGELAALDRSRYGLGIGAYDEHSGAWQLFTETELERAPAPEAPYGRLCARLSHLSLYALVEVQIADRQTGRLEAVRAPRDTRLTAAAFLASAAALLIALAGVSLWAHFRRARTG